MAGETHEWQYTNGAVENPRYVAEQVEKASTTASAVAAILQQPVAKLAAAQPEKPFDFLAEQIQSAGAEAAAGAAPATEFNAEEAQAYFREHKVAGALERATEAAVVKEAELDALPEFLASFFKEEQGKQD